MLNSSQIIRISASFAVLTMLVLPLGLVTRDKGYIRLHVVANSDSYPDQAIKEQVRDKLKESLGKQFAPEDSFDTVRNKIIQNLGMIEEISETTAKKANLSHEVSAMFGEFEFPSVRYGDLVLPAGKYQALKVIIGNGAGSNWWCVMYPPLCITEATRGEFIRNASPRRMN